MQFEYFLIVLVLIAIAIIPLLAIILSIVALVRTRAMRELSRRVEELETTIKRGVAPRPPIGSEPAESPYEVEVEVVAAEIVEPSAPREAFQWESFIGGKALGWAASVLLIFAAAFFLRYAYQNNWIGPVGRVAIGALVGTALMVVGQRYQRRGWRIFAQMVTSAGIVVLYLATYTAFGFYHLLPQQQAGIFLAVIVIESMIIAALFNSLSIGLVAVAGGLITPLLMHSETDLYAELFLYLAVFNLGTVVLMLLRSLPAIGSVSLLGTHGLFWYWYSENYHPEKFSWAIGFVVVLYAIFVMHTLVGALAVKRSETWEGLARMVVNSGLAFGAFFVLMDEDYHVWMGSSAVVIAVIYALLGRAALNWRPNDNRLLLTSLAVSAGFIALAFPIQAEAHWVAIGWAATAAALWWFGQRISALALRIMAIVLFASAVFRILGHVPRGVREPFIPVINEFALPSISVAVCIIAALIATRPFLSRIHAVERFLSATGGMIGVLMLWFVLSVDCYGYFQMLAAQPGADSEHLRWLGAAFAFNSVGGFCLDNACRRFSDRSWSLAMVGNCFVRLDGRQSIFCRHGQPRSVLSHIGVLHFGDRFGNCGASIPAFQAIRNSPSDGRVLR